MNNPVTASTDARNCFVFVVCGAAEHLDTLDYSLNALRRHSRSEIIVVTDSRRNEKPIEWSHVLDIATPPNLSHHQSSIFLKTELHRIVPAGPRYCYLDSDIVAVDSRVDDIFRFTPAPVLFAADHTSLREFSPYAVHCGCQMRNKRDLDEIRMDKLSAYDRLPRQPTESGLCSKPADYEQRASSPWWRWKMFFRWAVSGISASQRGESARQRWKRWWIEQQNSSLWEPPALVESVEQSTAWRRDKRRQSWISPAGEDVYHIGCDHLVQKIASKFGIVVKQPAWQHWNGGVFLFDTHSRPFLEAWHAKTMEIFTDPDWQTRDQGTLAATAWEFGLQNLPVLPQKFNSILDPYLGGLMLSEDGANLTRDAFLTYEQPCFVHVMYRFLDTTWDVWRWVAARAMGDAIHPSVGEP